MTTNKPIDVYMGHVIGAWKLAGKYDGLYYAFVDGLLDDDIQPSRYPAVVIRRIKKAWYYIFKREN